MAILWPTSLLFFEEQAISLDTDDDCGKLLLRDGDALAHFYTDFCRQLMITDKLVQVCIGGA